MVNGETPEFNARLFRRFVTIAPPANWLVYFLIGYAVFTTLFTGAVFGKRLIGLNFSQLQREADFRFNLIRAASMKRAGAP